MHVPTTDHRAPSFIRMLMPLLQDLRQIFKTESAEIIPLTTSGTGGWEAAITNTLSPGDKVLAPRYGQFSRRWIDLCQRHGLQVEIIDCSWGEGAPADKIEQILAADTAHAFKAVLVCHNETATGVRSDVAAVRGAMDVAGHPAMLYVDGVSSIACMDFRMDEWGVDLAIAGSQKGFMLATGMAIVAVSQKAMAASKHARCTRCYLDFGDMLSANRKGSFPYTPPLGLLFGLRESVDMLLEEGLGNVFARHHRIAQGVRLAVKAWNMPLCAARPALYSDTVSTIHVPRGFNSSDLVNHAYDAYGVSFGVGLGEVEGKVFRIGHLGAMSDVIALAGIATMEMAMKDLDYPIVLGSGLAAAQDFYRTGAVTPVAATAAGKPALTA